MSWKDIACLVIVGTLGASIMMSIAALAWRDKQLTQIGGEVLMATVTGLISVLSYRMGQKSNDQGQ